MCRISSVPVHMGDMYPLFIQRPFVWGFDWPMFRPQQFTRKRCACKRILQCAFMYRLRCATLLSCKRKWTLKYPFSVGLKRKLFFTDILFVYTKMVKTRVNIFSSKTLSKVETFKNATKETLCKCRINAENVKAKNANSETVFCQGYSTTKVGVDSEKPW